MNSIKQIRLVGLLKTNYVENCTTIFKNLNENVIYEAVTVGKNKICHNKPMMDKRVGRTKYPRRGWVSTLGTSADVIGHEEILSRKYEIVWLIDYIRICIEWLITHEFVCVNSHVWICIIGNLTCTCLWGIVRKGIVQKGTSRASGKETWWNGVVWEDKIEGIWGWAASSF